MVPILLYHSVSDDVDARFRPFSVSPAQFREQMEWLLAHRFSPITVSDWRNVIKAGNQHLLQNPILITFDDGFEDFYTEAFPILDDLNIRATLYVTTGFIGKTSEWLAKHGEGDRPMMSWTDLAYVQESGIEIGAHTVTHPQLDLLPMGEARYEIIESRRVLDNRLKHPVTSFAYPHGYFSADVRQAVIDAGYQSGAAVKNALSYVEDDPYALARVTILRDMSLAQFRRIACQIGLPTAKSHESVKTKGWRMFRRMGQKLSLPLGV